MPNQFVSECHKAARAYLERGWSALPICDPAHIGCGRRHAKHCSSPGKRPLIGDFDAWKPYQEQRIPAWLLDLEYRNHPNANVGIVLGEVSGLVGIDVDGNGGVDLLVSIARNAVPKTLCFRTANGFRLLYALAAGEVPPRNAKLENPNGEGRVEISGNGLCTVMPPSRHQSGKIYAWAAGYSPEERELAPIPEWLHRVASVGSRGGSAYQEGPITTFRNVRLFKAGCSLRRQGLDHEGILRCLEIINQRCEPPLEVSEVQKIARNSSRYEPQAYGVEA